MTEETNQQEMSDEEALAAIAKTMKDNAPMQEDKQSVPSFLFKVVQEDDSRKIGNLKEDKDINELGFPRHNVRGCLDMQRISTMIMKNPFFAEYFRQKSEETLATSLSRDGFLIRQATTQTKQVADVTKRRKINKGWFGKEKTEETGGTVV